MSTDRNREAERDESDRTGRGKILAAALSLLFASLLGGTPAAAFNAFGNAANSYCADNGRTPSMPYSGDCALCHSASDAGAARTALFDAYRQNDLDAFCPASPNSPPSIEAIPDQTVSEDGMLSIDVRAQDLDGDVVTLEAADLPTGADFADLGGGTGRFVWMPGFEQAGNYPVRFIATDDGSPPESASQSVMITVGDINRPPSLAPIPAQAIGVGERLQLTLSAADPDGDALVFGHGGLPGTASLVDAGDGTALFSWTPTASDTGNALVTITVTDDGIPMASDAGELAIAVGAVNQPPVLQPIGDRSARVDEDWQIQLVATDPNGGALDFECIGTPEGASVTPAGGGMATLSGAAASGLAGNYEIRCTVRDDATPPASDSETFTLTLGEVNRPPVLDPIGMTEEGTTVVVRVTARDPDGDALVFEVRDAPADADFMEMGPGVAELRWTPAAGTLGDFTLQFVVTDDGSPRESATGTITISLTAPETPALVLRRARWSERRGALRVLGTGAPGGSEVEILDADSGARLGTVIANEQGRFRGGFRLDDGQAPCRIQARLGSATSRVTPVRGSAGRCADRGPRIRSRTPETDEDDDHRDSHDDDDEIDEDDEDQEEDDEEEDED